MCSGPSKTEWHKVTRKHAREYPGSKISKANFADKLTEAANNFYRPATIINSFRSTGVYPRFRITVDMLAPGITHKEAGDASTALELLADMADRHTQHRPADITPAPPISAAAAPAVQLPISPARKPPPKRLLNTLPDNLTSTASLRTMALKDLQKIRKLAEREKAAKTRFLRKAAKVTSRAMLRVPSVQENGKTIKQPTDSARVSFVCQLCLPLTSL